MKITILGSDFNRIMKVCVPSVSKESARKSLHFIQVECDGYGNGTATALNGYTLAHVWFPCKGPACKMLIPPHKTVRKEAYIDIWYEDGKVSISEDDETITKGAPEGSEYVDHGKLTSDAQNKKKTITIALNPSLLQQILKSHRSSTSPIFFDIHEQDSPIIVYTVETSGMILPMRINSKMAEPQFGLVKRDV